MQKHEIKLVVIAAVVSVVAFGILVDGYFGFPVTSAASQWMLVLACLLTLGILFFYGYRFLAHWHSRRSKTPPVAKKVVHIFPMTVEQKMAHYLEQIRNLILILVIVTCITSCNTCQSIGSINRAVNSTWEIKPKRF